MATYKFPGVYASIRDFSGIVSNNNVTTAAYVGEAEYGPVFKPILLSTLQDYTDRFGKLSSKYGYAGYSLAVAAETINQHYFVRVVNTGNADDSDRSDNAKWAAADFMTDKSTERAPVSDGYFYEEIKAAQTAREAGLDAGLFDEDDYNSAFMIIANDPNDRKFYVSIADTTINENKAYPVTTPNSTVLETEEESGVVATKVTVFVEASEFVDSVPGDKIAVSRMANKALNGTFVIKTISISDDEKGNPETAAITYVVPSEETTAGDTNARIGLYPFDNETTFSVTVSEKVGRVMSVLETFPYCTLYQAQDAYGNSTYVEDVINDSSKYIQVFVNKNHEKEDPDVAIVPAEISNVALNGGKSGNFKDVAAKYSKLCEAWELFRDRSQTSVSLLLNSGYVLKNNTSYQEKMLEIAEARRDCFCLFDIPMTETAYEDATDWRKNIQGMNTYRAALSSPWVKTYDSVQGRANFIMCPSAYIAKIMGAYEPWQAPAGLNRGIIGSATVSPTGLTQYYDETYGGNLYTDYQINCLIRSVASGYANWGQRTLQQKPSALDRINVARTVIYIETVLRDAAQWHVFENNTSYERMQITLQFNAFLDQILSAEGIQAYRVVCDTSNNTPDVIARNQLMVDIYLYPTYTSEFIIIHSNVMGADTSVTVTTSN